MKCVVTNHPVIDDCSIMIDFGYGSDRDLQSFEFNTVSDELGEEILQLIASKLPKDKKLNDFRVDIFALADPFDRTGVDD